MKKNLILFLVAIMCLSICACNNGIENEIETEADAVGTYKSVGLFLRYECNLNANTTFDIDSEFYIEDRKGTYNVTENKEVALHPANNNDFKDNIWIKKGKYYYSTDQFYSKSFDEDTEYRLKPTFDANGYSNQSFKTVYYANKNVVFGYKVKFDLSLSEDGTYVANYEGDTTLTDERIFEEHFKGAYKFENDILWLNYEGKDYPMLFVDDKLYFDIIEKTE